MICGCISAGWKKTVDNYPTDETRIGLLPPHCIICGSDLDPDEISLTKKLINRGTKQYMCLKCLARKFEVSESALHDKIAYFREMGCTLFN